MNKQEMRLLQPEQLREKVEETRRTLFGLRLNMTTTQNKSSALLRETRRNIARLLTFIAQKDIKR